MHVNLSIGFGLPHKQWAARWSQSKFCLVIRGDTPSSHTLAAAAAGGCVPVIISSGFELTSLPSAAWLDLRTFAIMVSERYWRHGGLPQLITRLQAISNQDLDRKLVALAAAQPLLLWHHPQISRILPV